MSAFSFEEDSASLLEFLFIVGTDFKFFHSSDWQRARSWFKRD